MILYSWPNITGLQTAPVNHDSLNHLTWISLNTQEVHLTTLVHSKAQTTHDTVAHHLVLPSAVILLELVLEHLLGLVVDADDNAVLLALIERPERYGIYNDIDSVAWGMEPVFNGFILTSFRGFRRITKLKHVPVVAQSLDEPDTLGAALMAEFAQVEHLAVLGLLSPEG